MLKLKKIVHSHTDATIKYIFLTKDDLVIEFSYINKNDGKDIICVPCQTMCNMGCRFCHTAEYIGKIKCRNLTRSEIIDGVEYIYKDLNLSNTPRTLLISYMGCGEPSMNRDGVVGSMFNLKLNHKDIYVRFAIATSLPELECGFFNMVNEIHILKLPVKLHVSLHYTTDELRQEWMSESMNVKTSICCAEFYKLRTGNPVEIHYALLEGINDTEQDAIRLTDLIKGKGFNVKFLFYNQKKELNAKPSQLSKMEPFIKLFDEYDISHEYYIPPGLDIGASCGQFLMEEYISEKTNEQIISEHDNKLKNEISTITDNSVLTEMQKKINQEKI